MGYQVRGGTGVVLHEVSAIRQFHAGLSEDERCGMLWRLANQSLMSDVIIALHAFGYQASE